MSASIYSGGVGVTPAPAEELFFTVTDLKQYAYCPRVVFFERCLPRVRPRTHNMDMGRDEHQAEQRRAARRTLTKYELAGGRREFDVGLASRRYHLRGKVDEVVYGADGAVLPVDHKLTDKVSANHKLQLAAYALMLEDQFGCAVARGYIYLITSGKLVEIPITAAQRGQVLALLGDLFETVTRERMPGPTPVVARCASCEFRRFCNDV